MVGQTASLARPPRPSLPSHHPISSEQFRDPAIGNRFWESRPSQAEPNPVTSAFPVALSQLGMLAGG